jgi:hypothetical protein
LFGRMINLPFGVVAYGENGQDKGEEKKAAMSTNLCRVRVNAIDKIVLSLYFDAIANIEGTHHQHQ